MDFDLDAQLRALEEESASLFADLQSFVPHQSSSLSVDPTPRHAPQSSSFSQPARKNELEMSDAEYQKLKAELARKKDEEKEREKGKKGEADPEETLSAMERQNELLNQIFDDDERTKEERSRALDSTIKSSLEDIMSHALRIEEKRRQEMEEAEKTRKMKLKAVMELHAGKIQVQSQEFIDSLKQLLAAISQLNPGAYFQSTAAIATSAHGFLEIIDGISDDPQYPLDIKPDLKRLAEKILSKIKDIVEAAKTAAKNHPSESGISNLKDQALELAKIVKTLQAVTKYTD